MNQQDDMEKEARRLGERIGFLLASATLPEDMKQAILVLLPEMTPEQIDALVKMLEQNIAGATEVEANAFIENLKKIEGQHTQAKEQAETQALSELAEIEKLLGDE